MSDPQVTANLYAPGGLDAALGRLVAPLWRSWCERSTAPHALWWVRSLAGGEHLKLRFHVPPDEERELRRTLESASASFFADFHPAVEPRPVLPVLSRIAAIDPGDRGEVPPPGLVWTRSPRSPLSFGGPPLLGDEACAGRLAEAHARAGENALALLETAPAAAREVRQKVLLGVLVETLACLPAGLRASYLIYHRDVLLRYAAYGRPAESTGRLLAYFDLQALGSRPAVEFLGAALAAAPRSPAAFAAALFARGPALDPFAPEPELCPVFKVLHSQANQLGLGWLDEAFTHHLLWRAVAGLPAAAPEMPPAPPPAPLAPSGVDREEQSWKRLVGRSEPGRRWLEAYRPLEGFEAESTAILHLLRQGGIEDGERRLRLLLAAVREAGRAGGSQGRVLERWLAGVEAYADYCAGRYEAAAGCLERARGAVVEAIGRDRFLIPLANHCQEFTFHQARIARQERRWAAMREHLYRAERMGEGLLPLCTLDDGTEIRLGDLAEALTGPEGASIREVLFDPLRRRQAFEAFVQGIYLMPDLVLPWT